MTPQSLATQLKRHVRDQHRWAAGEIKFPPPALMVHGKQGIGKTSVVFQVAHDLGCEPVVVEGATQDPVEVGGLLDIDRASGIPHTVRAVSEIVAKIQHATKPVILCFDDFHQGARMIQAAFTSAMDIRRTIGGSPLPASCYIMGTMNLSEEKTVYHDIPTNLHTRMCHVYVSADLDGWCDRAIADGIAPELVAAVREEPELLHEIDYSRPEKGSSTGRTLYMADSYWKQRGEMEDHILQEFIRGSVGSTPGTKLYARLSMMADMPKIDEIIKAPRKVQVPKLAGAKYALARSLALRAQADTVLPIVTYLERLGAEHLTFALRFRIDQERQEPKAWPETSRLHRLEDFLTWLEKNQEYLSLVTGAAETGKAARG